MIHIIRGMLGKIEEIRGKQLEIQKKIEDENAKIDSLRKSIYFYVPSCLMVFTIFSWPPKVQQTQRTCFKPIKRAKNSDGHKQF